MDFLQFNPTYKVLICTSCKYALVPSTIASHLRNTHKGQLSSADIKDCLRAVSEMCLEEPILVQQKVILLSSPPIPHLTLCLDGIICRLCKIQAYICRNEGSIRSYLKKTHIWTCGEKAGRPSKASRDVENSFSIVTTSPVTCQTFYRSNFFRYFMVQPVRGAERTSIDTNTPSDTVNLALLSLEDYITLKLGQKLGDVELFIQEDDRYYTQVSLWLDVTQ